MDAMKKYGNLKEEQLDIFRKEYEGDKVQAVLRHAIFNHPIDTCVSVQEKLCDNMNHFSINIKTMKATNQFTSGRCWIFAGLNILREDVAKNLHINEMELSQNYTAFYDKLEKINFFLEMAMEMVDRDYDDRTLTWLLQSGIQDGGQWDMFVNIVEKYGIVPKDVMPETYQSCNTASMNLLINTRLRGFAQTVRDLHELGKDHEMEALKDVVLSDMYRLLCTCFGVPPKTFDFAYIDKDGNEHELKKQTPMGFYHDFVHTELTQYVSIIHAPTQNKAFYDIFHVKYINNVIDGTPIHYLNLPLNEFKLAIIAQLKEYNLVWFGSDCSKFNDKKGGFWDDQAFAYEVAFEINFSMSKEIAMDMRDSTMNHAMVISGVNLVNGIVNRWKIENSWGEEAGHKGFFVASDTWFEQFVYQAVVHKKFLTKQQLAYLSKEAKELEPWDPMGTLAQ